jgi:hypothetical protein
MITDDISTEERLKQTEETVKTLLSVRETLIALGRRQHDQRVLMLKAYRDIGAGQFRADTAHTDEERKNAKVEVRKLRLCIVMASRELARLEPMIDDLLKESDDLRSLCPLN